MARVALTLSVVAGVWLLSGWSHFGLEAQFNKGQELTENGRVVYVAQSKLEAEGSPNLADYLSNEERVCAEIEDIISGRDAIDAEDVAPDLRELGIDARGRWMPLRG